MSRRRLAPYGRLGVAPWLALVAAAGVVAGCEGTGPGAGDGDGVSVRDSAGIRIVESARPAWDDGAGLAVGDEPLLRIGSVEGGDPATHFTHVAAVVPRPGGGVVVVDSRTQEVRVFDGEGEWVRTAGGPGQGPGEVGAVGHVHLRGDTLVIWDIRNRRFAYLDLDGRHLDEHRPPMLMESTFFFSPVGRLPRGAVAGIVLDGGAAPPSGGAFESRVAVGILPDAEPPRVDSLMVLVNERHFVSRDGRIEPVPFQPFPVVRVGGDGTVVHPLGEKRGVVTWNEEAGTVIHARAGPGRRPLDGELRSRYEARELERASPENEPALRRLQQARPWPDSLPAYRNLVLAEKGHVWARLNWLPWEDHNDWDVFDPEGRWLGTVSLPPTFEPRWISADRVYGVRIGALDVPFVEVLPLVEAGRE